MASSEAAEKLATAANAPAPAETMTGAEAILRVLEENGVEVIFGYPGGAVLPIYDALFKNNAIRHILVRHEQAAVHAAEGYGQRASWVSCWSLPAPAPPMQ